MRTAIFNVSNGDRPDFADVAVLITDGEPTREVDKLYEEVMRIKRRNIGIVGVGVTRAVSVSIYNGVTGSQGHWVSALRGQKVTRSLVHRITRMRCRQGRN